MIRRYKFACAFVFASIAGWPITGRSETNVITCSLERVATEYNGHCEVPCLVNALAIDIDEPNPKVTCGSPPRRVAVVLRKTTNEHWLGTMVGKEPEDPTRFEIAAGRAGAPGIAKTPFGWFELQSAKVEGDKLNLTIAANKQLPPTTDDIRIIQHALSLIADVKVWNKEDNRICLPNPQKWSVFCALTQATIEVSGGVHYRQPALQMVREVLNEVGGQSLGQAPADGLQQSPGHDANRCPRSAAYCTGAPRTAAPQELRDA